MSRSLAICVALVWVFAGCNTFDDPSDGGSSGFFGDDDVFPVSPPQSLPPAVTQPPGFIDTPPRAGSGGSTGWTKLDGGTLDAADGGAPDDDAGR